MNYLFHYYSINFICKKAGFNDEDAFIIAYSSTLPDYLSVSYKIKNQDSKVYKSKRTFFYQGFNKDASKIVLPCFHFFPGDIDYPLSQRKDRKKNRYNTTPSSEQIKEVLIDSLKSKDLYKIGISIHTFYDTYAHQNFSGLNEDWNILKNAINSLLPPVGHVQVGFIVDDYYSNPWIDDRLLEENDTISNHQRYKEAFQKIYKYLCVYNNKSMDDAEFVWWDFEKILFGLNKEEASNNWDKIEGTKTVFNQSIKRNIKSGLKKGFAKGMRILNSNKLLIEDFEKIKNRDEFISEKMSSLLNIPKFNPFFWHQEAFDIDILLLENRFKDSSLYKSYLNFTNYLAFFSEKISENLNFISEYEFKAKPNFYESHFYKFCEAARSQEEKYLIIEKNL